MSEGSGRPSGPVPGCVDASADAGAAVESICDCHHHIYDAAFPAAPSAVLKPADASVLDYAALRRQLGLTHSVVVQPSTYGVDNRCMLDAIARLGLQTTRGVAVVDATVSQSELLAMHAAGVRGIRLNLRFRAGLGPDSLPAISKVIAPLGWHVQLHGDPEQLAQLEGVFERLDCPVVFDHLGMLGLDRAPLDPTFDFFRRVLSSGRAWIKLSGAYYLTDSFEDRREDVARLMRRLYDANPEQIVWGTNWPHPLETPGKRPDDKALLDMIEEWFGPAERTRILWENPGRLYGFIQPKK